MVRTRSNSGCFPFAGVLRGAKRVLRLPLESALAVAAATAMIVCAQAASASMAASVAPAAPAHAAERADGVIEQGTDTDVQAVKQMGYARGDPRGASLDPALVGAMLSRSVAGTDPTEEQAELLASDGAAGDWFGYSVAIDGNTAVIGAREDSNVFNWAGAAYVFRFDGSCWVEQAKLQASDPHIASEFGWSVAISGDTIVVGVPAQDTLGAAYVFVEPAGGWNSVASPILEDAILLASDRAPGDSLGCSVAIAGDHVLVGAAWDDNPNGNGAGAVYYYQEPPGGWDSVPSPIFETQKLLASDGATDDGFGISVAMSGWFMGYSAIIGADGDDDDGSNAGAAYVFWYDGALPAWVQQDKLLAGADGAPGDNFGDSVAIYGVPLDALAVIGAPFDDDPVQGQNSGSAYVFYKSPFVPGWSKVAKLLASDGAASDYFGASVGLSGTSTAVIGASMDDDNGSNSGSAYVFRVSSLAGGCFEVAKLLASDGAAGDHFGGSVAISGDTAVVGAWDHGHYYLSAGAAYVFAPEAVPDWFEDFDSYALGSGMHGQGGWKGWDNNPAGDAYVANAQALSAPHSVDIAGNSDLVHLYCGHTSGDWTYTAWMYVPGNFQSGGTTDRGSYFILLNTYNDGGPYNWSVQLHADSDTNTFIRDGVSPTSLPLITDRWVKVEVDIDVDPGGDLYRVFYGGFELGTAESWTAGVFGGGGGVLDIAAVDLFANGSTSVYWDDLSLKPGPPPRDRVVCEPQPPNHPPTYWYDVTPDLFGRCDFHVRVYDANPANYTSWNITPWPGTFPTTWVFAVHQVGSEWWASWWDSDPGCPNAFFIPTRFQFTNNNPSTWGKWTTTTSNTRAPYLGVVDSSDNHPAAPDGEGYRVHVPQAPPPKWIQPPMYNAASQHPECFWGWDSQSVYDWAVIVADDFPCDDEKPITDIHWWGSYSGWEFPEPPPLPNAPIAFHIGLWTNVPAGVDESFSHPGTMIKEWTPPIGELNETLVGCDFHNDWPSVYDYCYRYDFIIPEVEWFHQEPACSIYWISIAAIYPEPDPGAFEWGWKTREHYFEDDAVQMFWPSPTAPVLGNAYVTGGGVPIERPAGVSWDMAFVLTTECPSSNPPLPETPVVVPKNRYLSFIPQNPGQQTALRVTLTSSALFPADVGMQWWVGSPGPVSEKAASAGSDPPDFMAAELQNTWHCMDWSIVGLLDVSGCEIVPSATYDVQAIDCTCNPSIAANYSAPLAITTSLWGDVVGEYYTNPANCMVMPSGYVDCWSPPNGVVNF
ncbi:MAG: FG-GAP repeat protein, partial [Phycisphaerae bacterium]